MPEIHASTPSLLGRIKKIVGTWMRRIYIALPISFANKNWLKDTFFTLFAPLLKKTNSYRAWLQFKGQESNLTLKKGNEYPNSNITLTRYTKYIDAILEIPQRSQTSFVPIATEEVDATQLGARAIAFYLPQFHPIPENDTWWGRGFTEWTNVSKAVPQFIGHEQPHLPGELGFYDLRLIEVMRRQSELAKLYGIEGFCFHYYWFAGKKLLDLPLKQLIDSDIHLPFCICWANENWTRRWDGMDDDILIAQNYSPEDDLAFIETLIPLLLDPRYIRINGRPVIIVYRPSLLPDATATLLRWRTYCREVGIGELFLSMVQFDQHDPLKNGFDAAIEFPPHKIGQGIPPINQSLDIINPNYRGYIVDYDAIIDQALSEPAPQFPLIRGVCPSWDNEARKPGRGYTMANTSPSKYRAWLRSAMHFAEKHPVLGESLVFINAWNEWAEGAHLEPDRRHGYAYLNATKQALLKPQPHSVATTHVCVVIHAFYPELLPEIFAYLCDWQIPYRLIITAPKDHIPEIERHLNNAQLTAKINSHPNHGRDILPFIKTLQTEILPEDIVLKLHTKRSLHRSDGDRWRTEMLTQLLNPERAQQIFEAFKTSTDLGIVAPRGHILPLTTYWGANSATVQKLTSQMDGIRVNPEDELFAAGSMFYLRPAAAKKILEMNLTETDFETEAGQVDGTLAHALERCFGIAAWKVGYFMADSSAPCQPFSQFLKEYAYAKASEN
ncbi:MAG TPA: glycoside hydrolase family 99-like domain-containing protein [Halothiobacillus sp.]|jgi:lipopolysaccharide biosynthesis protein|uniref:glycoside hydrolase family 99-like domain-containing protein n=1 Tax=Polynucleobacter sp. 35-46-11 TaxID=1970425 RepID=UPI000BD5AEF3|nr:glycoside hydrolase family 99-like domain-containing protein [Polynucleobacter sp. 35-46-11]OYY17717.1 MAG: hypothetical protein B7Y67_07565 [Polynucleobacter sp. 35-46-11]HQS03910.1 glycoside hydrolase family 99-like domain-containing protein [Halothiobacillus sp.]